MRFDYDGTGDSAGDDGDPARVDQWLSSIGHAVTLARQSGARSVALVGMRMGALLAAAASRHLSAIDGLVLWDPCWSGSGFVKEQRATSLLRFGPTEHQDGASELPGYLYQADTVNELKGFRMPTGDICPNGRVLVLSRPDISVPAWARDELSVPAVEWMDAPDQAELIDVEPGRARVPVESIDAITTWLGNVVTGPRHEVSEPAGGRTIFASSGQHSFTERCVRFEPIGLFGIETSPLLPIPASSPTVLMVNTGKEWHAGPNRMWVQMARRLADAGLRTVRLDLSGMGDSPVHDGQPFQVTFAPEALDDVADVAAALSPGDPSNVILVGLCSGGYLALESALLLSLRGACVINPAFRFVPPETANGPIDPRRRINRPVNSAVRAYRMIPFSGLRRSLRSLAWRCANALGGDRSPSSWLGEFTTSGVDALCVGGEDEMRPLLEGSERTRSALIAAGQLRITMIPGLDHALLHSEHREQVITMVTDHLVDRFGPPAPAPASASISTSASAPVPTPTLVIDDPYVSDLTSRSAEAFMTTRVDEAYALSVGTSEGEG